MTDARAGKVAAKVLVQPNPEARVGAAALKALVQPNPQARVGAVALKVLVKQRLGLFGTLPMPSVALTGNYTNSASYEATVLSDGPLAYYRLGEATGPTLVDSSGNARHGTWGASPQLGQPSLLHTTADTAASFAAGGGDEAGAVATWIDLGAPWSMEIWLKGGATFTNRTAIGMHSPAGGGAGKAWRIRTAFSEVVPADVIILDDGTGNSIAVNGVLDNRPHHVVGTYDGTALRLYVDGVEQASTPLSGLAAATSDSIGIGGFPSQSDPAFQGTLDEGAFYGYALNASQVFNHYLAGWGPIGSFAATSRVPTTDLTGTWVMAPATGSFAVTPPKLTAALSGAYSIATDASNGLEGFQLGGWVINEAPDPADPTPPPIWTPTRRDDLALWLPPPTIVDGRIQ